MEPTIFEPRLKFKPRFKFFKFGPKKCFFNSSDLGFESNKFCLLQFLVDILPLGSGSIDPHTLTDPDPKLCKQQWEFLNEMMFINIKLKIFSHLCLNDRLVQGHIQRVEA